MLFSHGFQPEQGLAVCYFQDARCKGEASEEYCLIIISDLPDHGKKPHNQSALSWLQSGVLRCLPLPAAPACRVTSKRVLKPSSKHHNKLIQQQSCPWKAFFQQLHIKPGKAGMTL